MSIKVTRRLIKSHRRTCPFKRKLDMENAQEYLLAAQKDPKRYNKDSGELELYVCTACSFLHIGHPPKWRH